MLDWKWPVFVQFDIRHSDGIVGRCSSVSLATFWSAAQPRFARNVVRWHPRFVACPFPFRIEAVGEADPLTQTSYNASSSSKNSASCRML